MGEMLAEQFLTQRGFVVIERNFRCRSGEVDLIATERDALVFIEVKLRRSDAYGSPAEAVTYCKRQRLIRTARYYLARSSHKDMPLRFDVVSIQLDERLCRAQVRLVRDAFSLN